MSQLQDLGSVRGLMPESARNLAALLGDADALQLLALAGWQRLVIPLGMDAGPLARLAEQIGSQHLAERLRYFYAGEILEVPRCAAACRAVRDLDIHATAEAAVRAGRVLNHVVGELARKHGLSSRQVWKILKNPAPVLQGGQP